MRIAIWGVGAVGVRAARQLVSAPDLEAVLVHDADTARAEAVAASLGPAVNADLDGDRFDVDVAILAMPAGLHRSAAERFLETGAHVVSVSDSVDDVERLLALDAEAAERHRHVVVGAGFGPGLSCALAAYAATRLEAVDEIHVAKAGTAGPACARQHHHALHGESLDWRDGTWARRSTGSGRELCWFPDPIGARDCYRAALPDAMLHLAAFPTVRRVTARMAANRRDRVTARLPMLRRPHAEGGPGAVRVEVRGRRGAARDVVVLGAMDRPAVAAGAVSALASLWAVGGRLGPPGAGGLAALGDPGSFLAELADRGVKAAVFEGSAAA